MTDQSLALRQAQVPSAEAMIQMLAVAKALVDARMVPVGITKPGEALALILTGREMGIGPLRSVQDLYHVKGNVGMMTRFMVAHYRRAGHTHDILEKTPQHCKVVLHLREGRDVEVEFTRDEVNALGYPYYWQKDEQGRSTKAEKPQWKSDPAGLLYNRTMTKGIRTHAPECLYGMLTQEEIQDRGLAAGESGLASFLKQRHPDVWAEWADSQAPEQPSEREVAQGDVINGESRELPSPGDNGDKEPPGEPPTQKHWMEKQVKDGRPLRTIFWAWACEEKSLTKDHVYQALGTTDELQFPDMQEAKDLIDAYIDRQLAIGHSLNGIEQQEIPFL
ncbi:MAG TPA: hypothetical protein VM537_26705 [Anaerolineae bacterium]|nr:hypothetical protein [Anaerolineae bacterium]